MIGSRPSPRSRSWFRSTNSEEPTVNSANDRRWAILLGCNLILLFALQQLNHAVSPWGFALYAGGLLVSFPALRLSLRNGLFVTVPTALFSDAFLPLPYGTSLLLLTAAHLIIHHLRGRLAREEVRVGVITALVANFFIFSAITLLMRQDRPPSGWYWVRAGTDLALSEAAIALLGPWFLAVQHRGLALYGIDIEAEQREQH